MLQMDAHQLNAFFSAAFDGLRTYRVERVDEGGVSMRQPVDSVMLRPGGTVSGPTLMALADAVAYALILAHLGPVELAVTSSLNIVFLRKPQPTDVIAEASFLKLGRKLAVVDVRLRSDGGTDAIAQATVTYAIPSGSPSAGDGWVAGSPAG
jgi:uncharacterized protein (TIGR00369 family)